MKSKLFKKVIIGMLMATFLLVPAVNLLNAQSGIVQCDGPDGAGSRECDFDAFIATANKLIEFIIYLAASAAAILIAYAGFLYITAQGDSGKITQAHAIFKNIVIGFVVILLAWLFVKLILDVFETNEAVRGFLIN